MTAQLLADAQRVLRSCAGGSAAQLAQRSLAQQVAHRLLELKALTLTLTFIEGVVRG